LALGLTTVKGSLKDEEPAPELQEPTDATATVAAMSLVTDEVDPTPLTRAMANRPFCQLPIGPWGLGFRV
jgi:hypothetical protein